MGEALAIAMIMGFTGLAGRLRQRSLGRVGTKSTRVEGCCSNNLSPSTQSKPRRANASRK